MKYRIAVFQSKIEWGKELGVWLSDNAMFDTYDRAYLEREKILPHIDINTKCKVFSEVEWLGMSSGFKHEHNRKWMDNNPNPVVYEYSGVPNSLKKRPFKRHLDGSRFYPELYISTQRGLRRYKAYWSHDEPVEQPTTVIGADVFGDKVDLVTGMGAALKAAGL